MNHVDAFRWISVAVSIILGLGVARLLTSAVAQFHARRHRTLDWLPIAWAGTIFCQQLSFWWSLDELSTIVPHWTLAGFLVLIGLTLALFLAAALILPFSDSERIHSLRAFFDEDGRWALPVLAAYNGLAIVANGVFWGQSPTSAGTALNVCLAVLPLVAFRAQRRLQEAATATYVAIVAIGLNVLLPTEY